MKCVIFKKKKKITHCFDWESYIDPHKNIHNYNMEKKKKKILSSFCGGQFVKSKNPSE